MYSVVEFRNTKNIVFGAKRNKLTSEQQLDQKLKWITKILSFYSS